ncbi:hypothetical protein AKJ16_DCAP13302 [Drosera capensis]
MTVAIGEAALTGYHMFDGMFDHVNNVQLFESISRCLNEITRYVSYVSLYVNNGINMSLDVNDIAPICEDMPGCLHGHVPVISLSDMWMAVSRHVHLCSVRLWQQQSRLYEMALGNVAYVISSDIVSRITLWNVCASTFSAMAASRLPKRRRTSQIGDGEDPVEASVSPKLSPVVVCAHGTGAPSTSEWMIRLSKNMFHCEIVITCEHPIEMSNPYLVGGKRGAPPKAEKLVDFHLDAVKKTNLKYPGHPLILAGKSMGSRLCLADKFGSIVPLSMQASEIMKVKSRRIQAGFSLNISENELSIGELITFARPKHKNAASFLHTASHFYHFVLSDFRVSEDYVITENRIGIKPFIRGMKGAIRDEILVELTVPAIFIQGSKDSLCPLDKLEAVRKKMKSPTQLHVVEGGDQSFKIAKKHLLATGSTQEDAEQGAIQAIENFVSSSLHGG